MFAVIGLGIVGSSAALSLAERGHKVIGFDANSRGHALGSSHGRTRIIRQAYFEAPEYVPLLKSAYERWEQLEANVGKQLFLHCGGLFAGPPESELVSGSLRSAKEHNLNYEYLTRDEIERRFPCFKFPEDAYGVWEPDAGLLHADQCREATLKVATGYGANLHFDEPVLDWAADGSGYAIRTAKSTYRVDGIAIAAGAWSSQILEGLNIPFSVRRIVNVHFEPDDYSRFTPENCPIYCIDYPEYFLYGFPALPEQGMKIGEHRGGKHQPVDAIDRQVHEHEVEALRQALNRFLPGAAERVMATLTCIYVDTPDLHFIMDKHTAHEHVAYMSGCSGHAFKLAGTLGDCLADLVIDGSSQHPIDFLKLNRFAGTHA